METVRKEIVPSLVTIILLAILGYVLRRSGIATEPIELLSALALLVLLVLLIRFHRPVRRSLAIRAAEAELKRDGHDQQVRKFRHMLARLVEAPDESKLSEASGLMGWYSTFSDCRTRLEFLLTQATAVRLLTYIGRSDIGKGTIFYEAIARNRNASVRVLLCSEHSPYVSPDFAALIGHEETQALRWKRRILETQDDIRGLRQHHRIDITMKTHDIPFIWRLWFIDDILFVTAMLYYRGRENLKVPVYEIQRSADQQQKRLFEMFEKHFEREWDRGSDLQ